MTPMKKILYAGSALALFATAACENTRSITTEPADGLVGYGQNLLRVSATSLPRGRANFTATATAGPDAAADTIVLQLAGLDSLSSGSYVVWVGNNDGSKFARVTGDLRITRVDTTISSTGDPVFSTSVTNLTNVSEFKNGGPNKFMRFSAQRSNMAGFSDTDELGLILISVEASPGTQPGNVRPLWARRSEASSNISGLRFGNFMPNTADQYVYAISGTGVAPAIATNNNIPRGRIEARGDVMTVNDSNYYRPPVGYYYKAWAIKTGEFGVYVDTVSLGDKASPYPRRISYRDADISVPDPISMYVTEAACSPTATACPVAQPVIFAAQHRTLASQVGAVTEGVSWKDFSWVYVTLQSKLADDNMMGGVAIMNVNLPGSISGQ